MSSPRSRILFVGCWELKTRLETYMHQVRDGATIIVTKRGRPIAELRPTLACSGLEERLDQLASEGLVTREMREPPPLQDFQPIRVGSVSKGVTDHRQDRF